MDFCILLDAQFAVRSIKRQQINNSASCSRLNLFIAFHKNESEMLGTGFYGVSRTWGCSSFSFSMELNP
jgi:hypothetical protein